MHTLYHVFLCTLLLPVLGMLILYCLLSHQIVGKFCTCYLSPSAIHITPHHFSYFLFCPSPSTFYLWMFHCILGLVALTVSEWSALSCLVAVTFLSLRSTWFPATPDISIPGHQEWLLLLLLYKKTIKSLKPCIQTP